MDSNKRKQFANLFILPSIFFILVLLGFSFIQEDSSNITSANDPSININTDIPKGKEQIADNVDEAERLSQKNNNYNTLTDFERILADGEKEKEVEKQQMAQIAVQSDNNYNELKSFKTNSHSQNTTNNSRSEKLQSAILLADKEDNPYSDTERYADSILAANSKPITSVKNQDIQNKEPEKDKVIGSNTVKKEQQRRSRFSSSTINKKARSQAVIYRDQWVKNGNTVSIQLKEGLTLENGVFVPSGNFITAVVSFSTNRIRLTTKTILYKNNIYPFQRTIYSLDGLEGIEVPDNMKEEYSKAMKDLSVDKSAETLSDEITPSGGIIGGTVKGVIDVTKSIVKKKNNQVEILMRDGYELILE